jgi:hypothetical protein
MTIINLLSQKLVLTKRFVFKHIVSKILFFALVLFFLSSFNKPFPEPLYKTYLIEEDGTVHKCHRSNYLEMMEYFQVNEDNREYLEYLEWEHKDKFKKRVRKVQ